MWPPEFCGQNLAQESPKPSTEPTTIAPFLPSVHPRTKTTPKPSISPCRTKKTGQLLQPMCRKEGTKCQQSPRNRKCVSIKGSACTVYNTQKSNNLPFNPPEGGSPDYWFGIYLLLVAPPQLLLLLYLISFKAFIFSPPHVLTNTRLIPDTELMRGKYHVLNAIQTQHNILNITSTQFGIWQLILDNHPYFINKSGLWLLL